MKVYSWNVLFSNKTFDAALRFIADLDFDVLCLQEVPEHFLAGLKELPLHVATAPDVSRLCGDKTEHDFLVVLSKEKIAADASFPIPVPPTPLRTRLFARFMRPFGWSKICNRGGMFADINTSSGIVRVLNLHLTLASPRVRIEEFERAMRARETHLPTIVCGDFNILESARIAMLNWLLGGSLGDVLLWKRERRMMENRFRRYGFKNPLRKIRTHALSASQLDHILVPRDARVIDARVIRDPLGSDHCPVCVEFHNAWPDDLNPLISL